MLAFLIVWTLIPLLRKLAFRIGFVEKPYEDNERKIHKEPLPLTGGIGIFIGFAVVYPLFCGRFDRHSLAILAGSMMILVIGIIDDRVKTRGMDFPALPKLIVQVGAAILIYSSGIVFTGFHNPFSGGQVILPVWLQFLSTVTWIFGVTTVINFMDGMDGLAGGLSAISASTLFIVALAKGQQQSAVMAVILCGVVLGYLRYNRHPARILMGDSGATFLGFILGIIALDGAFKQATVISLFIPILALGLPIFDNIFVVIRRFANRKPIYKADASQVHYRLLSTGMNQRQVVTFLYLVSLCFSLTSIIILLLKV